MRRQAARSSREATGASSSASRRVTGSYRTTQSSPGTPASFWSNVPIRPIFSARWRNTSLASFMFKLPDNSPMMSSRTPKLPERSAAESRMRPQSCHSPIVASADRRLGGFAFLCCERRHSTERVSSTMKSSSTKPFPCSPSSSISALQLWCSESPGSSSPTSTFASNTTSGIVVERVAILDSVAATDGGDPAGPSEVFPGDCAATPVAANGGDNQFELLVVELLQSLSERPKLLRKGTWMGERSGHDESKVSTSGHQSSWDCSGLLDANPSKPIGQWHPGPLTRTGNTGSQWGPTRRCRSGNGAGAYGTLRPNTDRQWGLHRGMRRAERCCSDAQNCGAGSAQVKNILKFSKTLQPKTEKLESRQVQVHH